MPYNNESRAKHRATLIAKFNGDEEKMRQHMKELGRRGGASTTGAKGFALNRELARTAGALGGSISRSYKKKDTDGKPAKEDTKDESK